MNLKQIVGYILFGAFLVFVSGCSENKKSVIFEGKLIHSDQKTIFLYKVSPDGTFLIDSSDIKNGEFYLLDHVDKKSNLKDFPAFYKILISNTNYILTIANIGETIFLKANTDSLVKTYSVSGGKDAILISQLDKQLKLFIDSVNTLQNLYSVHQYNDSVKNIIENTYNLYVLNHQNYLTEFIRKNPESLATLNAFYQKFNRHIFFPEEENGLLLSEIYQHLKVKYPDNNNVHFIKNRLENLQK